MNEEFDEDDDEGNLFMECLVAGGVLLVLVSLAVLVVNVFSGTFK